MEEVGPTSKLTDQEVKRKALGWQDGSVNKGILSQLPPHTHTYSNKCNKKNWEREKRAFATQRDWEIVRRLNRKASFGSVQSSGNKLAF